MRHETFPVEGRAARSQEERSRPQRASLSLLCEVRQGSQPWKLARLIDLSETGFRLAWGKYRDGVFEDAEIYAQPWGFPLEDIRVPVRIWHGTEIT